MGLLVLGASGLLGSNVVAEAVVRGLEVTATHHSEQPALEVESVKIDLLDSSMFANLCQDVSPDVIINCAAMSDVDRCEQEPELATEVNGQAPGTLATIAEENEAAFVQVSTDYIFDGRSDALYPESAVPNPIQVYGQSKLLGEETVRKAHPAPIIPRLSFVYGRHAGSDELEGFPAWVIAQVSAGEPVPAFVDQRVTPTSARQAADTILDLIEVDSTGVFNVACTSCTSPYEFASLVAQFEDLDGGSIEQRSLSGFDRAADRPRNTCLKVDRVEKTLGRPQPTLEEDLRAVH